MFLLEQGPFSFDSQLSSGPRTQEVLLLGSARCAFEPELTLHRSNCPPSQSLSFPATIQTQGDKSRLRGVELWGLAYARRPLGGFSPLLVLHLALLGERATGASFSLFFHQKNLNFLTHCRSPTLVAELNPRPVQKPRASSCSRERALGVCRSRLERQHLLWGC